MATYIMEWPPLHEVKMASCENDPPSDTFLYALVLLTFMGYRRPYENRSGPQVKEPAFSSDHSESRVVCLSVSDNLGGVCLVNMTSWNGVRPSPHATRKRGTDTTERGVDQVNEIGHDA
jgi:hypothetical protein